jgi:hypothetical protein
MFKANDNFIAIYCRIYFLLNLIIYLFEKQIFNVFPIRFGYIDYCIVMANYYVFVLNLWTYNHYL